MGVAGREGFDFVAVGDVIPTRPIPLESDLPPAVAAAFGRIRSADVAFASLETVFTDRGTPADKVVCYRSPVDIAAGFAAIGFDVVSLANNQTLNYGWGALSDSMRLLESHGIHCIGAGEDANAAWRPHVIEIAGVSAAILAFTCVAPLGWAAGIDRPGLAAVRVRTSYELDARWEQEEPGVQPRVRTWLEQSEIERVTRAVVAARESADVVIVAVHWGLGSSGARSDYQLQLAGAITASGADLVLGSHSPHLQGIDATSDSFVSFSAGTFMRQQPRPAELSAVYEAMPKSGYVLTVGFDKQGLESARVEPTLIGEDDLAGLAPVADAEAALAVLESRSTFEGVKSVRQGNALVISRR